MKEVAIAIVSLVIGAIVGPYINWGIEKKKQKLAHQREFISRWRELVNRLITDEGGDRQFREVLLREPDWQSLRIYLSPQLIEDIESEKETMHWGVRDSPVLTNMTDEIGGLEKKWRLVE